MKKLEKLSINPDKVIKGKELIKLKGGGDEDPASIYCSDFEYNNLGCLQIPYCMDGEVPIGYCSGYYPEAV
jgi:hypothetical protein